MHTIGDELFEKTHNRYSKHCLTNSFVNAEGAHDGILSHNEAVICAMTSNPIGSCSFNLYSNLPILTLNTDLMECEQISVADFFKMCVINKEKSYGKKNELPIINYKDGYEKDESYSLGTVSGDTLKIRYSYAFLAPPYSTHYE